MTSLCNSSEESEQEEYWDVDEAEVIKDFNEDVGEEWIMDAPLSTSMSLLRVTTLFLLLWTSFYRIAGMFGRGKVWRIW